MLKLPNALEDITILPVRNKPDWVGFEARLVGALVWVGLKFGVVYALKFMGYYSVLSGVIYAPKGRDLGTVPFRKLMHEGLHDWQARNFSFYRTRYLLSQKQRRHFEAQAYALEVWGFGRDYESAVVALVNPIYRLGLSLTEADDLLLQYVVAFDLSAIPRPITLELKDDA